MIIIMKYTMIMTMMMMMIMMIMMIIIMMMMMIMMMIMMMMSGRVIGSMSWPPLPPGASTSGTSWAGPGLSESSGQWNIGCW